MSKSVFKNLPSGKTVRRKRTGKHPPFVMLQKYMITSRAWRSLPGEAIAAYVELVRRYDGMNNGTLHLSARELAALRPRISRQTATRAIRTLVEKGFVEIVRASGFNVKDRKRQAAEYRLTHLPCDVTRQPPSKAFMKWQPSENISRPHYVATPASPVRPCEKNIEESAPTTSPMRS
jgi:hypothetical protein